MKRLKRFLNHKVVTQAAGIGIGLIAIYFSIKNIRGETLRQSLSSMDTSWLIPIILGNFVVIAFKALRWQLIIKPVKNISFKLMYRVLTIGFMANNILPARLGEAVRIHLLGKDAAVSRITTTATLVADRIIEGVSFLILAALLTVFTDVPKWMYSGLIITLLATLLIYAASVIYSTRKIKNKILKKFQEGIRSLLHLRLTSLALATSLLSWFTQGLMIYMTQMAFGVHLPLWGVVLVLIAVNLAIALPSAPSHLGTFEFACILAYSYLGVDKSLGLLLGITYHLLQIIPVTLVGGLMALMSRPGFRKVLLTEGPGTPG